MPGICRKLRVMSSKDLPVIKLLLNSGGSGSLEFSITVADILDTAVLKVVPFFSVSACEGSLLCMFSCMSSIVRPTMLRS